MILYFTATGNSLYAARKLDNVIFSIPQEMQKTDRHYKDVNCKFKLDTQR